MSLYHSIFKKISPFFRRKRMKEFAAALQPSAQDSILDIGGTSWNWIMLGQYDLFVTMVDIHPYVIPRDASVLMPGLRQVVGNALSLDFQEGEFNIIFSNSVIEHVQSWENQRLFADEVRRVAGTSAGIWVQTPAKYFFIEPHFLTIGLHWLPKPWQRRLLPWLSGWGWIHRPTREKVDAMLDEIRLLTEDEVRRLFPDCRIIKEKFLGIFTKSYVAWRPKSTSTETTEGTQREL